MTTPRQSAFRDDELIRIRGARQHNLRNLTVELPRNRLIVITGPSGSGKSSLAFDTLYAEGQRRYVESLSAYARQFLDQMQKPDVDHIDGLSPAIAIEQRSAGSSPRSIVATTTEIYDYLRLLYAHTGTPHCPGCGREVQGQSAEAIVNELLELPGDRRMLLLAPVVRGRKGEHRDVLEKLHKEGFVRARIDGVLRGLDEEIVLERNFAHSIEAVVDRLKTGELDRTRLTESVERGLAAGDGVIMVLLEDPDNREQWHEETRSSHLACTSCNISFERLQPRNFSFNSPYGACPECHGLGNLPVIDPERIVDPTKSLQDGAIPLWRTGPRRLIIYHNRLMKCLADHLGFAVSTRWDRLPKAAQQAVLFGTEEEIPFNFRWAGKQRTITRQFEGVVANLTRRYNESESVLMRDKLKAVMTRRPCGKCEGRRLRPESLAVTVSGLRIHEFVAMPVHRAAAFANTLALPGEKAVIASEILREVRARLGFLESVGLGYLSLDRESGTLSGGEAQRIRLATQVGSGLVGVMYILDEPSIGLHQRDNDRLIETLRRLQTLGNTVIVVEHDLDTIRAADWVLDLGPGAGVHGGSIVASGTVAQILACPDSLTGSYLSGRRAVAVPTVRLPGNGNTLTITGAAANNLKNLSVVFPLGTFCCVTGVSGSGKSTLVNNILTRAVSRHFGLIGDPPGRHKKITGLEHVDKMIVIDQSPIGRTPRSNPATYTGAFDLIRTLFSQLADSRARGWKPGRFSFNVKGGRCEACTGDGTKKIEMQFLPDVYVDCEVCRGRRYNQETLLVHYRGKSIADILDMTIEEAAEFFKAVPKLKRILGTLDAVGLGYIRVGQAATTLSGGEAQRVKLASELARPQKGHTLYVLDEPTTGLHIDDVNKLLEVLLSLRDQGNTVLVIEHNLDVIKVADHIIDLGPEGGDGGGTLVMAGTPEEVAACPESYTGHYLKSVLPAASKPAKSAKSRKSAP